VVSVSPSSKEEFLHTLGEKGIPFRSIGQVTDGDMMMDGQSMGDIHRAEEIHESILPSFLH